MGILIHIEKKHVYLLSLLFLLVLGVIVIANHEATPNPGHDFSELGNIHNISVEGAITVNGSASSPPQNNTLVSENIIKAWVNFNGTVAGCPSSLCDLRDSYNIFNVTRNSLGDYTIFWDTDFANDGYIISGFTSDPSGSTGVIVSAITPERTVSKVRFRVLDLGTTPADAAAVNVIAIGSQ